MKIKTTLKLLITGITFASASALAATTLNTLPQKFSYSVGSIMAKNVMSQQADIDKNALVAGFTDTVQGNKLALSDQEMRDSIKTYMTEEQQKQNDAAVKKIEQHRQALTSDNNSPIMGNPKGSVTLVEFFDYQCVHCRHMAPIVEKLVTLDKDLRVVLKPFPIFGEQSVYATKVALAAAKQGKYTEVHNALLTSKKNLSQEEVLAIAKKAGVNMAQLKKDMNSKDIQNNIKDDYNLAKNLGINFTPAFIVMPTKAIDNVKSIYLPGAIDIKTLAQKIEQVQNKIPSQENFKFNDKDLTVTFPKDWQGI